MCSISFPLGIGKLRYAIKQIEMMGCKIVSLKNNGGLFLSRPAGRLGLYRISYESKINLNIADQRSRSQYVSWEQSNRDVLPLEKIFSTTIFSIW